MPRADQSPIAANRTAPPELVYGDYSGSSKIEGRAKETAKLIAETLKPKFQEQGWIK
jgi:hypothetical protein